MKTLDKKEECLKSIQNAYQALKLYQMKKEEGKDASDFVQTAFGSSKYAIVGVAQHLNLKNPIKDEIETIAKRNRDRHDRIEALENELSKDMVPEEFQENVKDLFKTIRRRWQKEGFAGITEECISRRGEVYVKLKVNPLERSFELMGDKTLKDQFETLKDKFYSHGLEVIKASSETFVIDSEKNREKLFKLIQVIFPGMEIWNMELSKQNDLFVLRRIEGIITNTSNLEDKNGKNQ